MSNLLIFSAYQQQTSFQELPESKIWTQISRSIISSAGSAFCRLYCGSDKATDSAAVDKLPTLKSSTFNNFQFQAKPSNFIFCVLLIYPE